MPLASSDALHMATELCKLNDSGLLYLTIFGSQLYGTSTGRSDLDIRGVFLPSLHSLALCRAKETLHYSTGDSLSSNCCEDVDIDLYSLQHFLLDLLPKGELGAIDVLFSPTNGKCTLFRTPIWDELYANAEYLLDLGDSCFYRQYAMRQTRKYGICGSYLGALRMVYDWLAGHDTPGRLGDWLEAILTACGNNKYCFAKELPQGQAVVVCGKVHMANIKMEEFRQRIKRDMHQYGVRVQAAQANEGLDFKAISHAMRALEEMRELLQSGQIRFPLAVRDRIMDIKKGAVPWNELEKEILKGVDEVDCLRKQCAGNFAFDKLWAETFISECYGLTPN